MHKPLKIIHQIQKSKYQICLMKAIDVKNLTCSIIVTWMKLHDEKNSEKNGK